MRPAPRVSTVLQVDFRPRTSGARDRLFDEHLNRECDPYDIAGRTFLAADVLFALDPASYDDARGEWEADFRERVAREFPHPIAHCFDRFQNEDSVGRRVDLLLDTFEASIVFLEAMLLAFVQRAGVPVVNSGVRRAYVDSRNLVDRIHVVRQLTAAQESTFAKRIDSAIFGVCDQLRELRNTVAHGSTPSEEVSASLLERVEPLALGLLKEFSWFCDIELFRHVKRLDQAERVQIFVGESVSPRMKERCYPTETARELRSGEAFHVYAAFEEQVLLLSPLIIWRKNGSGKSELSCLKKCVGNGESAQLFYESFGDCGEQPLADPRLRNELATLKTNFVGGQDVPA